MRWRRAPAGGVERRQISLLALTSAASLGVVLVPFGSGTPPRPVTAAILAGLTTIGWLVLPAWVLKERGTDSD